MPKLQDLKFKQGTYLAFVLDDECRASLIAQFQPKHPHLVCHHVTVLFNLTERGLQELQARVVSEPVLKVIGYTNTAELDVLSVTLDGQAERVKSVGGYYHVTHSIEAGVKPVRSNGVLEARGGKPQTSCDPLKLTGEFKLEPR